MADVQQMTQAERVMADVQQATQAERVMADVQQTTQAERVMADVQQATQAERVMADVQQTMEEEAEDSADIPQYLLLLPSAQPSDSTQAARTPRYGYTQFKPLTQEEVAESKYDKLYPSGHARGRTGYTQIKPPRQHEVEESQYVQLDPGSTRDSHTGTSDTNATTETASEDYLAIVDQSKAFIAEGEDMFVSTESFRTASTLLGQSGVVVIVGPPGTGKTSVGRALVRGMARTGYTPLVLDGLREWRSHVGGDRKQAVLLDGVWGEGRLQGDWWQTWGPLLQSLPQLLSQHKCVLVVTVYMHILKEIESADKPQDLLHHLPTVDLGSADPFSAMEKELMLINHVTHLSLSLDSHVLHDVIEKDTSGPFFPWYCEQFARQLRDKTAHHGNAEAGVSRADVFSSTALAYVGFFRAVVEDADSWRDLVPLLVLVMNGQSDVIGHVEDALTELSSLGVECEAGGVSTLHQLSLFLRGSVLSEDGEQFLTRDVYLGLGLALYAAGRTELLLRACDGLFLVNHVTTHTTPHPPGLLITPTSPHYPAFLERVCGDLTRGRVVEIGQHPSLHHHRFLADLEVSLRNRRLLPSALTVCDPDRHLPLLYWSAWTSPPSHVYSNKGSQAGLSLSQWCIKLCPQGVEEARVLRKTLLVCCLLGERVDSPRVAYMLDKVCENTLLLNDVMSTISLPLPPAKHVLTQELRDRCDMFSTSRLPSLFCGEASMHEVSEADRCIPPSIISLEVEPAVRVKLTPRCVRWYTAYRLLSMCDVNETNRDGYTLLHTAAFTGDLGAVRYLTDRGCRVTAITHRGNTPFTKAVEANKVEVVSHLLGTGHSLQELSGGRGVTACVRGVVVNRHADMLRLLLEHGALDFIRSCDQRGGVSLLRDARGVKQNDQVVSILKSYGVRSGQLTCCWSGH